MTLPEVLVAIVVLGMIVTVLSSAVIVTLRQENNTDGRLNVARSEQTIGMWIPADLSSADTVDTSPDATPCGAPVCDGIDLTDGSNVLHAVVVDRDPAPAPSPPTSPTTSRRPSSGGNYELSRVVCSSSGSGWTCSRSSCCASCPDRPPATRSFRASPAAPPVAPPSIRCRAPAPTG